MDGFKRGRWLKGWVAIATLVALVFTLTWIPKPALADTTELGLYQYSVSMTEDKPSGNVYLSAQGTTASVGDYDWIVLYDHKPNDSGQPRGFDPNYLEYFYMSKTTAKVTSVPWKEGLYANYSSYDYKKGTYVTVAQAGPTQRAQPKLTEE